MSTVRKVRRQIWVAKHNRRIAEHLWLIVRWNTSTLPKHKQHSTRTALPYQRDGLKLKEETSKMLHLEHSFFCMVLKRGHCGRYLGSFETWCCRRMENISWIDHLRNEEVLQVVQEERNIIQTIKWSITGVVTSCVGTVTYNSLDSGKDRGYGKTREKLQTVAGRF
jgi:hypothetical protein